MSNYQRIRVENVCQRLGLVSMAYLWNQDQSILLQQMIDSGLNAILIKVAVIGLTKSHLGQTLSQMQPHLLAMKEKYGINVCGEGGEFESLTLDCPLFKKRIVIDESEIRVHSEDMFVTVAYLHIKSYHLVSK